MKDAELQESTGASSVERLRDFYPSASVIRFELWELYMAGFEAQPVSPVTYSDRAHLVLLLTEAITEAFYSESPPAA